MTRTPHCTLVVFTALTLVAAGAQAQKVYRCGSSYSQVPCEGATTVDAEDARSAAQKTASDKAIARDTRVGDAMEKARLKEEARVLALDAENRKAEEKKAKELAARNKAAKADATAKAGEATDSQGDVLGAKAHKKTGKKKKAEPDYFVAKTGETKPK